MRGRLKLCLKCMALEVRGGLGLSNLLSCWLLWADHRAVFRLLEVELVLGFTGMLCEAFVVWIFGWFIRLRASFNVRYCIQLIQWGMAERATTQNDVRQLVGKDCIPSSAQAPEGKNQTCCPVPLKWAWSARVAMSQVLCVRLSWGHRWFQSKWGGALLRFTTWGLSCRLPTKGKFF